MVLQNREVIQEFGKKVFSGIYLPTSFASRAPVIIAILAKLDILANGFGKMIRNVSFYQTDTGICGEHIVLRAQELGLGTCWIGWFDEREARKFLGVPKDLRIPCLLSLGYPAQPIPEARPRLSLEELILKWIK
jgi:nitroreductase